MASWEKDVGWLGGAITKHYRGDDMDFRVLIGGIPSLAKDQLVERIEAEAKHFIENERHPELDFAYRDCVYKPMLELLRALEANGFSNYIVSGGGRDFMRGFALERVYDYEQGAEKALVLAADRNWQVISMKEDWQEVFMVV